MRKRGKAVRKMKFGTYPYTVTRVKVMQSKLLGAEDYLRMRKMGLNEMIRFLEESEYKSEIDSLGKEFAGTELIELALNQNLANLANKLAAISIKDEVRQLIALYSLKWVLANVKLVLRARMNKLEDRDLRYGLVPIKPMDYEAAASMRRESDEEVLRTVSRISHAEAKRLAGLYGAGDLAGLENEIDASFYARLIGLEKRLKLRKDDPLREFFGLLVYLMNVRNIVKFKAEGMKEDAVRGMIVLPGAGDRRFSSRKGQDRLIEGMIRAGDLGPVFELLKKSRYKDLVTPDVEANPSRLEAAVDRFLLAYASKLLHRKPLSISPIFGYLLRKEIETKNIRLLVHSKAMGLDEKFVDSNLISVGRAE